MRHKLNQILEYIATSMLDHYPSKRHKSYPKVAFRGIEDTKRNTDSWVLGVVKSLDAFSCMSNERAFCG